MLREIEFSRSGASGGEPLFFSQNKKFKKRSSRRHTIFFFWGKNWGLAPPTPPSAFFFLNFFKDMYERERRSEEVENEPSAVDAL